MPSLNSIELIGRLGKEPETRFTPTGKKVTTVSLAVGQRWTAAEGSWKEQTEWVNIEAWERVAEVCQQYLHKGRLVFIEGRLKTDRYEEEGETRYFTKVVAGTMQMLERKPEEEDAPEMSVEEDAGRSDAGEGVRYGMSKSQVASNEVKSRVMASIRHITLLLYFRDYRSA